MSDQMKTPWKLTFDDGGPNEPALRDASGRIIADCYDLARAKRIVASVNACADIAIEQLDLDIAAGGERALFACLEATIDEMLKERNELLAALVGMVQEPQPLGIDRESYQTAIALVIKHHDDVDNPEAWAARRAEA